eukprot:Hpha_TRINITY_DN2682_c0_g1::TRINITY_DN2682_c0_g1_i1::g.145755::m.145755
MLPVLISLLSVGLRPSECIAVVSAAWSATACCKAGMWKGGCSASCACPGGYRLSHSQTCKTTGCTPFCQCVDLCPTNNPTTPPSLFPTVPPTPRPPSLTPSGAPTTTSPTANPTHSPTNPTVSPSIRPTTTPSASPTTSPTTSVPSGSPSFPPTRSPSLSPTATPTISSPSRQPSVSPTVSPTVPPTAAPTESPTSSPTLSPSNAPSFKRPRERIAGLEAAGIPVAVLAISSGSSGPMMAGLLSMNAVCPQNGDPEEIPSVLHPLGIRIGGGDWAQYAGVTVCNAAMLGAALLLSLCLERLIRWRVSRRRRLHLAEGRDVPEPDPLLIQWAARWGMVLQPVGVLLPGLVTGGVTLIENHPSVGWKVVGGVAVAGGLVVPYLVYRVTRQVHYNALVVPVEGAGGLSGWLFGHEEWEAREGKTEWVRLQHLAFSTLLPRHLLVTSGTMLFVASVAMVQAFTPKSKEQCVVRASVLLALLVAYAAYHLICRVFISGLDRFCERVVAIGDVVMVVCLLVSNVNGLEDDHWVVVWNQNVEVKVTLWCTIKAIFDSVMFIRDEYSQWKEFPSGGGKYAGTSRPVRWMRFVLYFFFFKGIVDILIDRVRTGFFRRVLRPRPPQKELVSVEVAAQTPEEEPRPEPPLLSPLLSVTSKPSFSPRLAVKAACAKPRDGPSRGQAPPKKGASPKKGRSSSKRRGGRKSKRQTEGVGLCFCDLPPLPDDWLPGAADVPQSPALPRRTTFPSRSPRRALSYCEVSERSKAPRSGSKGLLARAGTSAGGQGETLGPASLSPKRRKSEGKKERRTACPLDL